MSAPDWVSESFPGDGLQLPSDEERDRADRMIDEFNERWNEKHPHPERRHPDVTDEGFGNYLAGTPTNRAYMRSRLRRWWAKR